MSHSSLCHECLHLMTPIQILQLAFLSPMVILFQTKHFQFLNYSSNHQIDIGLFLPLPSKRSTNGVKERRLDDIMSVTKTILSNTMLCGEGNVVVQKFYHGCSRSFKQPCSK